MSQTSDYFARQESKTPKIDWVRRETLCQGPASDLHVRSDTVDSECKTVLSFPSNHILKPQGIYHIASWIGGRFQFFKSRIDMRLALHGLRFHSSFILSTMFLFEFFQAIKTEQTDHAHMKL